MITPAEERSPVIEKKQTAEAFLTLSKTLVLSLVILSSLCAGRIEALDIWVTDPWLAMLTRFIGGVQVTVHPIITWDERGQPVKARTSPPARGVVFSVMKGCLLYTSRCV